ncbi:hypothetical protein WJX74_005439 [Apatococcus lobatus]|uniref:Uncharacterized protein n=1 Tax=Apatococcus lobatus TaxID=904363 RepID=A0AAW1Q571_9CHLO
MTSCLPSEVTGQVADFLVKNKLQPKALMKYEKQTMEDIVAAFMCWAKENGLELGIYSDVTSFLRSLCNKGNGPSASKPADAPGDDEEEEDSDDDLPPAKRSRKRKGKKPKDKTDLDHVTDCAYIKHIAPVIAVDGWDPEWRQLVSRHNEKVEKVIKCMQERTEEGKRMDLKLIKDKIRRKYQNARKKARVAIKNATKAEAEAQKAPEPDAAAAENKENAAAN